MLCDAIREFTHGTTSDMSMPLRPIAVQIRASGIREYYRDATSGLGYRTGATRLFSPLTHTYISANIEI